MKKFATIALAVVLSMGILTGCGSSKKAAEATTEVKEETVDYGQGLNEDGTLEGVKATDYVTVCDYSALKIPKKEVKVSDSDVQTEIDTILSSYNQVTDRKVKKGDTVNIDYKGMVDGKEFDGGTASGASLKIGSGTFIDGFEDGLIGVKPGEKKTLNLKFPDDYKTNPDLAGKAVVFDVTVNYIEGDDIVPELTDDFVKGLSITDVSTVDEYRAYVKSQLQTNKESEAESSKQKELLQQAVDNAEIKEIPEELVTEYSAQYTSYYQQYASYFGMEFSDFLTQYMNQTEDDFNKDAADYGKQVAGNMLVVCAIAKAEKIDPDTLYDEKVAQYAKQSGFSDVATLEKDYSQKYLRQVIINEEVLNVLEENAVAVAPTETESEASK